MTKALHLAKAALTGENSGLMHIDAPFAKRLEASEEYGGILYAQALASVKPEGGATILPVAGGHAIFAGVGSPVTQAVGCGLDGEVSREEFDRLEDFYFSRGAASQIVLCPLAHASFFEQVRDRGYRLTEFNNVLLRLVKADESFPETPEHIQITHVVSGEDGDTWTRTLCSGFSGGETDPTKRAAAEAMLNDFFMPVARVNNAMRFLARIDGQPAGGAAMAIIDQAKIAAFFGAATLPEFRSRGVQTALFHERLRIAAGSGAEWSVVVTQPGTSSCRNAERLGFMLAYTKVVMVREQN